jgi:adenylate cyclase
MTDVTVVFADLTGSTGLFESLGNTKATRAITSLTQWIGKLSTAHGGRVVKYLGDGVLMVFADNAKAVGAVIEIQRLHQQRIGDWPQQLRMGLQIGMARGKIVEQGGDCFGDAVNLASRLSDLSGREQIFATSAVIDQLNQSGTASAIRSICLGELDIRGRTEACVVHKIEWQSEVLSELMTVRAALGESTPDSREFGALPEIELSWMDTRTGFTQKQLPIFLGRDLNAQFVVKDPRVSRRHANVEFRAGKFYIEDVSSYGTWVRFSDTRAVLALRRQECVLMTDGEIALGASFEDFTVPTVRFKLQTAGSSISARIALSFGESQN